ncbi:RagB/SusD family nutrient uptake outer membrane protein [Flammeovirga pacifica]|uniref:RagB/SusD family nutrient uptake outer membrane protein n=1 Tax=Flammeovirga pacifica TaxID=915059 RepID=A0A1S1YSF8_FLAPC|nr:RagB/SusD family nutrient uptake outer membrane protein [Flammeovirga pacifica]OHX63803.1 hypothetical protein NH26_24730 [Flammeovirga pacifica]
MYKYINQIKTLTVAVCLSITSCVSLLDEKPISTLSNSNFEHVEDLEQVAIGMYQALTLKGPVVSNLANWSVLYPSYGWGIMGTDILSMTEAQATKTASKFTTYSLSQTDEQVEVHWTNIYQLINRANNVIDLAQKAKGDDELRNRYIAEARFLRAFSYMDLVQFYGGVPLRLKPTVNIETELGESRATEAEVWNVIIEDLEFAEQYLIEDHTGVEGRATKWAAKGLLAKAYLTMGGYPNANYQDPMWFEKSAQKAYEVISGSGKILNPTTEGNPGAFTEYGQQFLESGENSQESIFEIQFHYSQDNTGSGWGSRTITSKGEYNESEYGTFYTKGGGTVVGTDFALSFEDKDIRFQWSIGPYALKAGNVRQVKPFSGWTCYKFKWENFPTNSWETSVNAPVLRLADIYLIFAEASNEALGDPNSSTYGMSAYDAINQVRKRAQVVEMDDTYLMTDSPYSSSDLLYNMSYESFDKANQFYDGRHVYYTGSLKERFRSAVLMERAWELCFERHRWFDLKRTGNLVEFARGTTIAGGGKLNKGALLDPVDKSDFAKNQLPKKGNQVWSPSTRIQEHNLYLPIPNVEIQINPGISQGDQNPGY